MLTAVLDNTVEAGIITLLHIAKQCDVRTLTMFDTSNAPNGGEI